jgi:hypothetical protein
MSNSLALLSLNAIFITRRLHEKIFQRFFEIGYGIHSAFPFSVLCFRSRMYEWASVFSEQAINILFLLNN